MALGTAVDAVRKRIQRSTPVTKREADRENRCIIAALAQRESELKAPSSPLRPEPAEPAKPSEPERAARQRNIQKSGEAERVEPRPGTGGPPVGAERSRWKRVFGG